MSDALLCALDEYASVITVCGWQAGESVIERYRTEHPDFPKYSMALLLLLRANEILNEDEFVA